MTQADNVHVMLTRSGGFAGMNITLADIDTASLPPDQAQRLREMVDRAHITELPPVLAEAPGADRLQRTLTVETANYRRSVQIGEGEAPESLQPLLDYLNEAGKGTSGAT